MWHRAEIIEVLDISVKVNCICIRSVFWLWITTCESKCIYLSFRPFLFYFIENDYFGWFDQFSNLLHWKCRCSMLTMERWVRWKIRMFDFCTSNSRNIQFMRIVAAWTDANRTKAFGHWKRWKSSQNVWMTFSRIQSWLKCWMSTLRQVIIFHIWLHAQTKTRITHFQKWFD